MLLKINFIGIILTAGICFSEHISRPNMEIVLNEIFPNGSIVVGKQPWTINWKIFLERVNDTLVILETYNLDKESQPILMRSDTLFVLNLNSNKNKIVFAKRGRIQLSHSEGNLILEGITRKKVNLYSDSLKKSELNWCRNKSYIDNERQKLINSNGYVVAEIIDDIYKRENVLRLCDSIKNQDFISYYINNIREKISKNINRKENINRIKKDLPASLPISE